MIDKAGSFNPASAHCWVCKGEKKTHKEMLICTINTNHRDLFSWCASPSHTPTSCVLRLWIITVQWPPPSRCIIQYPTGAVVCTCVHKCTSGSPACVCCLIPCFHVSVTRCTGFALACDPSGSVRALSLSEYLSRCARGVSLSLSVRAAWEAWHRNPSIWIIIFNVYFLSFLFCCSAAPKALLFKITRARGNV